MQSAQRTVVAVVHAFASCELVLHGIFLDLERFFAALFFEQQKHIFILPFVLFFC